MRVSVLINNYNYGRYLAACIDSALSQEDVDHEVIVVDDGSTDQSRDIISTYGTRIRPVLKPNGGQASCFNAGFAAATGDIICLLDADDAFLPGKLSRVVELFDQYDLGWCFDRVTNDLTDQIVEPLEVQLTDYRQSVGIGVFPALAAPTSGLSFSRATLEQILPMAEAEDVVLSDNYLKFAAAFLGHGAIVSPPMTFQRLHDSNRYTASSTADGLRSRIMVATGRELARRHKGLQLLGRSLAAGGLATSDLRWPALAREALRVGGDVALGGRPAAFAALVARKRLIGLVRR